MTAKKNTSIRLSNAAIELRKRIADRLGVSLTAVDEISIRETADRLGIRLDEQGGENEGKTAETNKAD